MTTETNPIVKTLNLSRYPGWTIRKYTDGTWDASHINGALSPVVNDFEQALYFVRHGRSWSGK